MVWTFAIIYSIPTVTSDNVFGYWYIDEYIDDAVVCWIQIQPPKGDPINYIPWVMLDIPIIIVYIGNLVLLYNTYKRLKLGISRTVIHRMRVLIINAINVAMCLCYWVVLLAFYGGTYLALSPDPNTQAPFFMFKILVFMIASKGFSAIMVWVVVSNIDFKKGLMLHDDEHEKLDFNSALRQEILFYATAGIKKCAKEAKQLTATVKSLKIKVRGL